MIKQEVRKPKVQKRHKSIRVKLSGTSEFPRLAVYRSTKHIYAQLIDDVNHVTLAIAKKAKVKGIECVVFDRGGFLYHGRVAALADAAREAGLMF